MTKPTNEQLEFARRMTPKQRNTLWALSMFPFYLTASERGDPEMYALIKHKLASCFSLEPNMGGFPGWQATVAGKAIMRRITEGKL